MSERWLWIRRSADQVRKTWITSAEVQSVWIKNATLLESEFLIVYQFGADIRVLIREDHVKGFFLDDLGE